MVSRQRDALAGAAVDRQGQRPGGRRLARSGSAPRDRTLTGIPPMSSSAAGRVQASHRITKKTPILPNAGDAGRRAPRLVFHPSCIGAAGSRPGENRCAVREGGCVPMRFGCDGRTGERLPTMGMAATGGAGAVSRREAARAPGAENDDSELVSRMNKVMPCFEMTSSPNPDVRRRVAVPAGCAGAVGTALHRLGAVSASVLRGRPVRPQGPMSRMFHRLAGVPARGRPRRPLRGVRPSGGSRGRRPAPQGRPLAQRRTVGDLPRQRVGDRLRRLLRET